MSALFHLVSILDFAERLQIPRWMNIMDTLLVAHPSPVSRRLRVLHKAEDSIPKTCLVGLCVTAFMSFYIMILLLFFTTVFLLPFALSGGLIVVAVLAMLGAKASFGSFVYVWKLVDRCTSSFLLGISYNSSEAVHNAPDQHHLQDEEA